MVLGTGCGKSAELDRVEIGHANEKKKVAAVEAIE